MNPAWLKMPFGVGGHIAGPTIQVPKSATLVEFGNDPADRWIVGEATRKYYDPFADVKDLYIRFANVGSSESAMIQFIERYGMPFSGWLGNVAPSPSRVPKRGVRVSDFRTAVADLRLLIDGLDSLGMRSQSKLWKKRHAIADAVSRYFLSQFPPSSTKPTETLEDYRRMCLEDPELGTRMLATYQLNHYLGDIRYLVGVDEDRVPAAWPQVMTFMQAVYVQFITSFAKGRSSGVCECGSVFTRRRSDRVYCSDSCSARVRMKNKRERDRLQRLRSQS